MPWHCAIVGRFVQIRTASVVQAAGHVLGKFSPSPDSQQAGLAVGEALRYGFETRLEGLALRLALVGCPRRVERPAALVVGEFHRF